MSLSVVSLAGLGPVPKYALGIVVLVVLAVAWRLIVQRGDRPLSGPRLNLDSFYKKRAFGIGCIAIPLAPIFVIGAIGVDSSW